MRPSASIGLAVFGLRVPLSRWPFWLVALVRFGSKAAATGLGRKIRSRGAGIDGMQAPFASTACADAGLRLTDPAA
jgi:hypothetical protein